MEREERDRYQREIEELLRNMQDFVPEETLVQRARKRTTYFITCLRASLAYFATHLSARHLFIAAIALTMASLLLRSAMPRFAAYGSLVALVLFLVAVVALIAGDRRSEQRFWRGRPMDTSGGNGAGPHWRYAAQLWAGLLRSLGRWLRPR